MRRRRALFVGEGKVPRRRCASGWPPTASRLAAYDEPPRRRSPPCPPARRCWSTRGASPSACASASPAACAVVEAINPSTLLKSRKTDAEAAHVRAAMEQDGAAMCEFYAGFEPALARGERPDRADVDERLTAARARRPGYVGPSFATIAGFNANGAMPHYRATPESHASIDGDAACC